MLRKIRDMFFWSRGVRWLQVASALLVLWFLFQIVPGNSAGSGYVVVEIILFAVLMAIALAVAIGFEVREWPMTRANLRAARAARRALRSGRALPIPLLPRQRPPAEAREFALVRHNTWRLIDVTWGASASAPVTAAGQSIEGAAANRPEDFDRAVGQVRALRGTVEQAGELIGTFARMPAPWCYVGAAELIFHFASLHALMWDPYGLRQGLRFVALAQQADPTNADALVSRAMLLAACPDPRWLELAAQTYDQLRAVAPNHPRLLHVSAFLCWQAGDVEQALAYTEREIEQPPTPEEGAAAGANRAAQLWQLGHYAAAVAAYQALLHSHDDDPWLWFNLAMLLASLKRYDEALAANQRALALTTLPSAVEFGAQLRATMRQQGTPDMPGTP